MAIHLASLGQQHSPQGRALLHTMAVTMVLLFASATRKLRTKSLETIQELKANMEETIHSPGFIFPTLIFICSWFLHLLRFFISLNYVHLYLVGVRKSNQHLAILVLILKLLVEPVTVSSSPAC